MCIYIYAVGLYIECDVKAVIIDRVEQRSPDTA